MMKKIKDYLLEDCGKTRAYDLWTSGALIAYMIGNIYLSHKLDKVTHQKKKLESEMEYKDMLLGLQRQTMDDYSKVVDELTDKLEEEK